MRWLLPALAALLMHTAQAADTCLLPGSQKEFPAQIGAGFERAQVTDFEAKTPGAGCGVRYRHVSGMWADVFVFTGGHGRIDDQPRDPRLLSEFSAAVNSVQRGWTEQKATVGDVITRYESRGRAAPVEALSGWARIDSPSAGVLRTHLLVWSGSGVMWKLRVSYPDSDRAAADLIVTDLGHTLVDLSRGKP